MDIDMMLDDIDRLRNTALLLGNIKYQEDVRTMLKVICFGLIYVFVATRGMRRVHPSGHDLLLLLYVSYLVNNYHPHDV